MADVTSSREPCAINPQSLGLLTLGLHTGGRGRRGWVNWKVGIDVYSLPQRNRKLLYGAGSSAQLAHSHQPGLCRAAVGRHPLQISANVSSPLFFLKPLLMQAKLSYLCSTGKQYSASS